MTMILAKPPFILFFTLRGFSPFHRSFGGPQNRLARMLDPPIGRLSVASERLKRCVVSLQNEDFSNHLRVLKKFHPWISQVHFEDEETESTAQNSYNRRESAHLRDHLPEAFRRAIARFNDIDMVLYEQGVEQFYQQVTLARKSTVTLPASHLVPALITLPAKDWESTWPFFQEQLPTTFFMRRVLRCKITRLASQCARLIGTSMPDGVAGWWLFSNFSNIFLLSGNWGKISQFDQICGLVQPPGGLYAPTRLGGNHSAGHEPGILQITT